MYVKFSAERGTLMLVGEMVKCTDAYAWAFKPKIWATPENPARCPVTLLIHHFVWLSTISELTTPKMMKSVVKGTRKKTNILPERPW